MELTYVLVLLIVCYTTATPYGYGTKGGAAAKADASAVAGAYTGVGDVPVNIPSNTGYSGGFSKSYSSSASSSSASSSSSSYSYSGSGSVAFPGAIGGVGGCGSGNCHGSPAAGTQTHSDANGASLSHGVGGKIPSGSYGHKYNHGGIQTNQAQDCGSKDCQGSQGTDSLASSGTGTGSQSTSNAKASANAGRESGSNCGGSECKNSPGDKCTSGGCESNNKCLSGDCGTDSNNSSPSNYGGEPCTSGRCGSKLDTESSSSIDNYGTNDIKVPISESSNYDSNRDSSQHSDNGKTTTSGCSSGNCGPSSSTDFKPHQNSLSAPGSSTAPGYSKPATHLTTPKLESPCTSLSCQNAPINTPSEYGTGHTFGSSTSHDNNPSCVGGICGQTQAPYTNTANKNSIHQEPLSYNRPPNGKPDYSHGSSPTFTPENSMGSTCTPGSPNCVAVSSISGSAPEYAGTTNIKPNYSQEDSISYTPVQPSDTSCAPGTECAIPDSDCKSGNCGAKPSLPLSGGSLNIKPHGTSSPYSPVNPIGSTCAPGTPGCALKPSADSASECVSGYCGASSPSVPSNNPSVSSITKTSYSPVSLLNPSCLPGNPGCGPAPSPVSYDASYNIKPSYSNGISNPYSPVIPSNAPCYPGTPGCATYPSGCASGKCGTVPSSAGYAGSLNIKPSYTQGFPSPFSPINPSIPACAPGSPGCTSVSPGYEGSSNLPGNLAGCAPGAPNCAIVPSSPGYNNIASIKPSFVPNSPTINPLGPSCSPGTPGCGSTSSTTGYGSTYIKPSYAPAASPSYSSTSCAPGKPGCLPNNQVLPISSISSGYPDEKLPTSATVKPLESDCLPGSSGCGTTSPINSPSGCVSGNCGSYSSSAAYGGSFIKPSHSYGNLPTLVQPSGPACVPGSLGCTSSSVRPPVCAPGTPGCSSDSHINAGSPASGYGASSIGTTLTQATFGVHGAGSIHSSYGKPSTGVPAIVPSDASGSGIAAPDSAHPGHNQPSGFSFGTSGIGPDTSFLTPGNPTAPSTAVLPPHIGSHSYNKPASGSSVLNNVGSIAASSIGGIAKDKPYAGGFGGPAGILKPNEFSVTPFTSSSNKPATPSIGSPSIPPSCISGNCNQAGQTSPSLTHSGSNSGALASASASATADAVAYTGGFGGPPGLLKPYDDGKIDHKGPTGKQLGPSYGLNQELGGSDSTYSNGRSQAGGNAVAQANAATYSSSGSHANGGAVGCRSGCGGSNGYNGFDHSKTGALDNLSNGAAGANAGAVAKSIATASSGAKSGGGGSYASSSASAHATAGSSIKGGYGRR